MKVSQLIELLQQMPQDAKVVWQGAGDSDGGYDDKVNNVADMSDTPLGKRLRGAVVALRG
ncbi:TPA: hypothetical protein QHB43_004608 [Aeromonas hydrophila subsp. hydrophila]|nr:hypothetical protein [Aeromonas hydrophila subsp. hydrophila]